MTDTIKRLSTIIVNMASIAIVLGCATTPSSNWIDEIENKREIAPSYFKDSTSEFNNIIWYRDLEGIHNVDIINQKDTLVMQKSGFLYSYSDYMLSPSKSEVAFMVQGNGKKGLILLNLQSKEWKPILWVPDTTWLTFEWSQDGQYLGIGYQTDIYLEKVENVGGDLMIYSIKDDTIRSIGCKVSRIFKSWLPNGLVAVESYNNIYLVDTVDCNTVNTFNGWKDKERIRFSPDGLKVLYFKRVPVYYPQKGQTLKVNELFIADANGQNEQKIFNYKRATSKARWSPDSRWIACETNSPKWSNVKQIVLYNCKEDSSFSIIRSDSYGQISTEDPNWSADGSKLVYSISALYLEEYTDDLYGFDLSIGIFNLADNSISTWPNKMTRDGIKGWIGESWGNIIGWLGNEYIFTTQKDSNRIYDLRGRLVFSFPESQRPFAISRSTKE